MSSLRIDCFGSPQIFLNDVPQHIGRRKALALLAYLALTEQAQQRQSLALLLWPDYAPAAALAELRRALSTLNRTLGKTWFQTSRAVIGLAWDRDIEVDVLEFRRTVAAARRSPAAIPTLAPLVNEAANGFMVGFSLSDAPAFDDWQTLEGQVLQQDLAWALATLSRETKDLNRALDFARRWLALDPLQEAAQTQVMVLLARRGDAAAALRQYQTYQQTLQQTLQAEPSSTLQSLYRQIRDGEFQSATAIITAPAPSPAPALPPLRTPLVGREVELAELQAWFDEPETRLVTLTGTGGIGKTQLALALGHHLAATADHDADGLIWIDLTTIDRADRLVPRLLDGLGLSPYGNAPLQSQLIDYLRHKQLLLLLDNFEQLLNDDAGTDAPLVLDTLLQEVPGLRLLVTSRTRLNLHGERVFHVLGLPFPPLNAPHPETFAAVQLFVQRAQDVNHRFTLRQTDYKDVVQLCQLVQGMPLALDMAAAWTRLLSVTEILTELQVGLDLLRTEQVNLSPRHHSMTAVFAWSWQLLSRPEQIVFARLSIFRGGFTRDAARTVAGASLTDLASLSDKSLVNRDPDGRFAMHVLLRQFAAERRLEQPALATETRRSFCQWYADFAAAQEAQLHRGHHLDAINSLAIEIDNLLAAWDWAVEDRRSDWLAALQGSVITFLAERSRFAEVVTLVSRALVVIVEADWPLLHLQLQLHRARAQFHLGQYEAAQTALPAVLAAAEAQSLLLPQLEARQLMANVFDDLGERAAARTQLDVVLNLIVADEFLSQKQRALRERGVLSTWDGDYEAAERDLQASLQLAEQAQNLSEVARTLNSLAINHGRQENYQAALRLYERARDIHQRLGNRWGVAVTTHNLGMIKADLEDYPASIDLLQTALREHESIGHRRGMMGGLAALGLTYFKQASFAEARHHFEQALALGLALDVKALIAAVMLDLGRVAQAQAQPVRAVTLISAALAQEALFHNYRQFGEAALQTLSETLPLDEFAAAQAAAAVPIEALARDMLGS